MASANDRRPEAAVLREGTSGSTWTVATSSCFGSRSGSERAGRALNVRARSNPNLLRTLPEPRQMQSEGQATPRARDGSAEPHGGEMEQHLRTSNSNLYAVGDCCARHKCTHASMAIGQPDGRNALDPVARSLRLAAGAVARPDLNGEAALFLRGRDGTRDLSRLHRSLFRLCAGVRALRVRLYRHDRDGKLRSDVPRLLGNLLGLSRLYEPWLATRGRGLRGLCPRV